MARSNQTKRRQGRRLAYWLALAVVIHAELALVLGLVAFFWAPRNGDLGGVNAPGFGPGESIEISTVDSETARKALAELEKREEEQKAEEAKKEEEAAKPPGQVVDLAKPREEKRPDDARFAAEHDSSVEKETRKYGKFDDKARQGDKSGEAEVSRAATPPSQPAPARGAMAPGALAMRPPGEKGRPTPTGAPGAPGPSTLGLEGTAVP